MSHLKLQLESCATTPSPLCSFSWHGGWILCLPDCLRVSHWITQQCCLAKSSGGPPISISTALGCALCTCVPEPQFYTDTEDQNLCPHACGRGHLPTATSLPSFWSRQGLALWTRLASNFQHRPLGAGITGLCYHIQLKLLPLRLVASCYLHKSIYNECTSTFKQYWRL